MAAWSSILSNEVVTFRDISELVAAGGALSKQTIPVSDECITKADLLAYVNVDENNTTLLPKSNNELVAKRDVSPVFVQLDYYSNATYAEIWDTQTEAQRRPTSKPVSPYTTSVLFKKSKRFYLGYAIRNTGAIATIGATTISLDMPRKWIPTEQLGGVNIYFDDGTTGIPVASVSGNYDSVNEILSATINATIPAGQAVYVYFILDFSLFGTSYNTSCDYSDIATVTISSQNAVTLIDNNRTLSTYDFAPVFETFTNQNYVSATDQIPVGSNFTYDIYTYLVPQYATDYWDITSMNIIVTLPAEIDYVSSTAPTTNVTYNNDGSKTVVMSGTDLIYLSTSQPTSDFQKHTYLTVKFNTKDVIRQVTYIITDAELCPSLDGSVSEISTANTTPILTYQGYSTCYNCGNYDVYRDTNPDSPSYNNYFVNGVNVGAAPANTTCNYSPSLVYQNYTTCVGCTTYPVYRDLNGCSSTYLHYYVNGSSVSTTAPTSGSCNTNAILEYQAYTTCVGCTTYAVYRDINPCSATYLQYYVNTSFVGTTAPTSGVCNTSQTLVYQGYQTCVNCDYYDVYRDTNSCSSTYLHYFVQGVDKGTTAPSSAPCSGCCTEYILINNTGSDQTVYYTNCAGQSASIFVIRQVNETICARNNTSLTLNGVIALDTGGCS